MKLDKAPNVSERGKIIIDGDVIAYRAAFSSEDSNEIDTQLKVDQVMSFILRNTRSTSEYDDYSLYLTGSKNFRTELAVSYPYKGNRSNKPKPKYLPHARWYLQDNYGAVVIEGQEADDAIAIEATNLGTSSIVVSIDKDMLQIPCFHFNQNKQQWWSVSEFEGLEFFYEQILTGDTADNIIGLKGIGPVKAKKILKGAESEQDLWDAVLAAYNGDEERVIENARLLWLRRYEEQLWLPPSADEEQSPQDTDQD